MAISDDTSAMVAASLTNAWATRIGQASLDEAGEVGPKLIAVYRQFLSEIGDKPVDIDAWIASQKG